eukprot:8527283-Alexandrium_andersonii.AAC.1
MVLEQHRFVLNAYGLKGAVVALPARVSMLESVVQAPVWTRAHPSPLHATRNAQGLEGAVVALAAGSR